MYKIGEVIIPNYGPWVHPVTSLSYPANWISLSTESQRIAINIEEYPDPTPPDPTLEQLKASKHAAIESRTQAIYAGGVPAQHNTTWYRFDTRTGARAAANWAMLANINGLVLAGAVPEASVFPKNISTIGDGTVLVLTTVAQSVAFWIQLMTYDSTIATEGATLRKSVTDATTIEAVNAIVDNRPIPYPFPS
jgi:hypothetical protein